MMREQVMRLRERRAALSERARAERERFAELAGAMRRPLAFAAGAALLVALRPRRVLRWLASGWSALQVYRAARLWWARSGAGPRAAG